MTNRSNGILKDMCLASLCQIVFRLRHSYYGRDRTLYPLESGLFSIKRYPRPRVTHVLAVIVSSVSKFAMRQESRPTTNQARRDAQPYVRAAA